MKTLISLFSAVGILSYRWVNYPKFLFVIFFIILAIGCFGIMSDFVEADKKAKRRAKK